ncbi:MAG TPA: ADP-forming succinate--CoA ligase subunit beta [Gammaproteobacteria bacterium]|jgi:succinyl-CoA synthetase beta subunit|nr:ADP-forming succinate--CoA ligase subunit beta [Arenicellales bacterium]MDP6791784.1 ADP-forming succinate--CoA ligase subunit beta [Arenicellales bacterium]MDP6918563.1 ADP-forming succinate--CoA ligase subunit beta [Arenicellales bacterium]HCX86856.1 ADP-forming succinate--CoA ligase subunit beta [Gammaproteobacteria bacterium]|tara:strand:+ start:13654 stop:14817 length:1164 start_codon:yes stop_codon:yes gene_type:complete
MKVHEYQAKEILRSRGVPVPRGGPCFSAGEAVNVARELGGSRWLVKAQIHAGGRGRGGGVKVVDSLEAVHNAADEILGMTLVTHQTGPAGQQVSRLLIEEGVDIARELYVGLVIDRSSQRVVVMASSEGGTEIEEVAARSPEKILKTFVDPKTGLAHDEALDMMRKLELDPAQAEDGARFLSLLFEAFWETDASLAEINPLVITADDRVIALDAKFNFDDNALFRHPEIVAMRDTDEEDPAELEASAVGLSYISLDGNIGCLVNGAGLAMATMDIIKLYGGEPANFLDVGGGATTDQVTEAFKIMLRNPDLKAILVNIFGGIMRCDVVAEGLVQAAAVVKLKIPLVVRLEGTNVERGREILEKSDLDMITATTMADAAEKVVAVTGN